MVLRIPEGTQEKTVWTLPSSNHDTQLADRVNDRWVGGLTD